MKKIVLSMLLMATIVVSYAYPVYSYARIEATEHIANYKLGNIKVIIGENITEFKTLEEAFKYLGDNGYELVTSYVSNKAKDAHHFYTFMRKEND